LGSGQKEQPVRAQEGGGMNWRDWLFGLLIALTWIFGMGTLWAMVHMALN
jgi:hypothetical protein